MKVLELLEEIDEIVDTAQGVPFTGKIMVDANELLEIVKEIRTELPEEIHHAQWIKEERQRILEQAESEKAAIVKEAQLQAEALVERDDITLRAKKVADELLRTTEANCKKLKMDTYNYVDSLLFESQEKMEYINAVYLNDMFGNLEKTFAGISETLTNNREEIKQMAYITQNEE